MPKIKAAASRNTSPSRSRPSSPRAIRLFLERGYENVTLGDIAVGIGLARNSLYRYFPDKAHILLRWFQSELPGRSPGPPNCLADRVTRYDVSRLGRSASSTTPRLPSMASSP